MRTPNGIKRADSSATEAKRWNAYLKNDAICFGELTTEFLEGLLFTTFNSTGEN